ncbi:YggS family pyridoxal phosphate-dependent enzyme [Granulicoccus sp. GXG6511]|uniref:YggS family pyridoxal phosphate-dependent enzyme n=1 Tax=Granulicoccus sp. GXG6511 TaxID=3381351 RepID=UPI003D7D3B0B
MSGSVDLLANLTSVRERIAAACVAAGRRPEEVRLLPVSKTHGVDQILAVHAAGERTFGENRVQEAEAKAEDLADTDIRWAVIGHLQTNKAKNLARFAHEFHALDSLRVAKELDKRLQNEGRSLDVLIQVNSSAEPQKFGLPPEEVEGFAEQLGPFSSLKVTGLMTLAVFSRDPAEVEPCFVRMTELQRRLLDNDRAAGSYQELSMGMSGDFELAIAHGATCVRVGEAIFGDRLDPNAYWDSRAVRE